MANATQTDATDADITRELERARVQVRQSLDWSSEYVNGTVLYGTAYVRPWGVFSPGTAGQTNGGTLPVGTMRDAQGSAVTGWTVSRDGWVTFDTPNTSGSSYSFTAFGYDVALAASRILEDMAATELRQFDVDLNGDDIKRSQKAKALQDHAKLLRKRAIATHAPVRQSDATGW